MKRVESDLSRLQAKSKIAGSRSVERVESGKVVASHASDWLIENVVPDLREETSFSAELGLGFTVGLPNYSSLRFNAQLAGRFSAKTSPRKVARMLTKTLIEELSIMAREAGLTEGFRDFVRRTAK